MEDTIRKGSRADPVGPGYSKALASYLGWVGSPWRV